VGETLAPSVRRQLRPVLVLVLLSTGLVANLPLVGLSFLIRRFQPDWVLSQRWVAAVLLFCLLLDWVLVTCGRPKPWATHTQVPQWWGHQFGPWWGSARYGLRLGLGPATILNSWLWWGALAVTLSSPGSLALGALAFVFLRTLTTMAVSWGVDSGSAMALRAQQLDLVAVRVRYGVLAVTAVALLASLLFE
jgi:hypothetical protein